jgi:glycolate oxidase FAD binding subunit
MPITSSSEADATLDPLRQRIRDAASQQTPLRLRGGGSKDWYGATLEGEILDTRGHRGIVAYEPAELVVTARCGTPLRELEAALAEKGQMLAFEPPHFGPDATLGGCVAAGLSGPRRQAAGALRDFMLGVVVMDGRGEVLRFGGQVMKNVAGYDVARLMAGSLGTLGLIVQVSLKVLPRPPEEATLRFALDEASALRTLHAWATKPLPLSASAWQGGVLSVRLSGAPAALRAARAELGGEAMDEGEASALWHDLRELRDPFFAPSTRGAPLWRLALPSDAAPLDLPGAQLIEWGGAERWWITSAGAETVRAAAQREGGHATLFRNGDKAGGVFTPLSAPLWAIHQRLKTAFDPAGIFNPGRMYPAL